MLTSRKGLVRALNYEFDRLQLEAVALVVRNQSHVRIKARNGVVVLPNAYMALMCVAGVKTDAPWNERMDALTKLLALAE